MFAADNPFMAQARLAVRVLRYVAKEKRFALKGGTAINLFYRDLPRLSVDLDLTFVKVMGRDESLKAIAEALERIAVDVEKGMVGTRVDRQNVSRGRFVVQDSSARVTVEVNTVIRGGVRDPQRIMARPVVQDRFGDIEANVMSFDDCFGGKLVAALDRQHPRDLFDVAQLLASEGLTRGLLDAFVVYLVSHDRPMAEVLVPREKDIKQLYDNEFVDMAADAVPLESLVETRTRLIGDLRKAFLPKHSEFLRSIKSLAPDWSLLPYPHIADLPAVRWRLQNLEKLKAEQPAKYAEARDRLLQILKGFA